VVDVRAGESDVFAVEEGGQPRRIVGDDIDHDIQMCPTVSPDGALLAYLALDSTTITPTPAPVPEGQPFGPNPSYVGPPSLWFEIVGFDASGTPSGDARRIAIPPTTDGGVGCPRWSPDGTGLAFTVDLPQGGRQLIVVGLDATLTTLARGGTFDWSPDGRRLVVGDTAAWLVPVDGGPAQPLIGVVPNAVAWSPDGSRIAVRTPVELLVVRPDGQVVFRQSRPQDDSPVVLWAPDGSWLAEAYGGKVHLTSPDGTQSTTLEIGVAALFPDATPDADFTPGIGLVAWSPDSRRLLLTASPMFDQNALITVDPDGRKPPVIVLGPSLALRGVQAQQASWQGVGR
jgi:dipeptidyl aminopeptidase/acylaminoacyl peptidase